MGDMKSPSGYHGRRRASLPAISLQQHLLTPRVDTSRIASPRRGKAATTDNIPDYKKKATTPRRPSTRGVISPPRNVSPNAKISSKLKKNDHSSSDSSPEDSPRHSQPPAVPYNRGRRHSVDVLLPSHTKPEDSDEVETTRRKWTAFCRVSDPHNFDATEYEKDCPTGTSLFRSVLTDLKEDEIDVGNDVTASRNQKKNKKPMNGDRDAKRESRRKVRFRSGASDSDSDS